MAILLGVVGVALAVLCVWLAVRIINRPKKPGVVFWATVVVVVAVLYVASVGPVYWIDRWVTGPGLFNDACAVVYAPLRVAYRIGPQPFRDAQDCYARLWRID